MLGRSVDDAVEGVAGRIIAHRLRSAHQHVRRQRLSVRQHFCRPALVAAVAHGLHIEIDHAAVVSVGVAAKHVVNDAAEAGVAGPILPATGGNDTSGERGCERAQRISRGRVPSYYWRTMGSMQTSFMQTFRLKK